MKSNEFISQEEKVSSAFSRQAKLFNELDLQNPIIQWMRSEVRRHMIKILEPNSSILELNAGTGLDAFFFAERGFHVHATDNARDMISIMKESLQKRPKNLQEKITIEQCSFHDLTSIPGKKFNHIFSNFGGLNCVDNIETVIRQFDRLLLERGIVTLVVMPPFCPWEYMLALKGNFKTAFRRLKKTGAKTHLEGVYFTTYYHSPNKIIKLFGKNYKAILIKGLGITVPPPYLNSFAINHPHIFKMLAFLEKYICRLPFFSSCGDHSIVCVQKVN